MCLYVRFQGKKIVFIFLFHNFARQSEAPTVPNVSSCISPQNTFECWFTKFESRTNFTDIKVLIYGSELKYIKPFTLYPGGGIGSIWPRFSARNLGASVSTTRIETQSSQSQFSSQFEIETTQIETWESAERRLLIGRTYWAQVRWAVLNSQFSMGK